MQATVNVKNSGFGKYIVISGGILAKSICKKLIPIITLTPGTYAVSLINNAKVIATS